MISIIIVHYKVKKELFACLQSIIVSKPKAAFEIIVVDNDEHKMIATDLKKRFPRILYVPNKNRGFGEACNVGAKHAKGDYLFFLNPDTEVFSETIDSLLHFLQKKKDAGIVAPLLLGSDGKAYQQGTLELTPKRGIFALSFLNKMFPNNLVSKKYFLLDWDRKSTKEVDVAPGTAFMMKKSLFDKVGGFDEKFFLFFEEFDLCKRIRTLGYKIFIYPKAHITHAWGVSTRQRSDINTIFQNSRFYYFRKHFGVITALLTESALRFSKYTALLLLFLSVGLFFRLFHFHEAMPFIADQAWYYISARDMVQTGTIPLVGIASSHPWLYQGALWTYMLAGGFWLFGFSPFVGGYISIVIGMLSIVGIYWLGSAMFSRRVGIIAAALFATSPLVIASDRMPYHTSPIPLVTLIFIYCLFKWVKGNIRFFPLVIAALGILYNLELATALLGMATIFIWLYGFMAKKSWAREVLRPQSLVLSLIAFATSMLPMLVYDIGHGFPQTFGFAAWIGYKVLVLFGFPPLGHTTSVPFIDVGLFFIDQMRILLFPYSKWVAIFLLIASVGYLFLSFRAESRNLIAAAFKNKKVVGDPSISVGMTIIFLLNSILLVGFFAARTPSGAYLPMMFPSLILLVAFLFDWGINQRKKLGTLGVLSLVSINSYFLFTYNYGSDFVDRLQVAKQIVKEAEGKEYTIKGRVSGQELENYGLNYGYLAWWLGHGPSKEKQKLEFKVIEENSKITLVKSIKGTKSTKSIKSF